MLSSQEYTCACVCCDRRNSGTRFVVVPYCSNVSSFTCHPVPSVPSSSHCTVRNSECIRCSEKTEVQSRDDRAMQAAPSSCMHHRQRARIISKIIHINMKEYIEWSKAAYFSTQLSRSLDDLGGSSRHGAPRPSTYRYRHQTDARTYQSHKTQNFMPTMAEVTSLVRLPGLLAVMLLYKFSAERGSQTHKAHKSNRIK
jgi:hypothetical protein